MDETRQNLTLGAINRDDTQLRTKQELALYALLRGASVSEAAKAAGVCRQTASQWVSSDENFRATLESEKTLQRMEIRRSLQAAIQRSVEVLRELLESENDRTRLLAAKALLSQTADMTEKPNDFMPLQFRPSFSGIPMPETPAERENVRLLYEVLVNKAKAMTALMQGEDAGCR